MSLSVPVSVNVRRVVDRILEVVGSIELECRFGGSRCNEENVKIEIEKILDRDLWSILGIERPIYEARLGPGAEVKSYKRADALYGLTIFEYKSPDKNLGTFSNREKCLEQLKKYIDLALTNDEVIKLIEEVRSRKLIPYIFGIIWNGKQVIFAEYNVEKKTLIVDPPTGAYELRENTLRRIITAVTSSWKKRFTPINLAADFGYSSGIARFAVKVLYEKLDNPSPKTEVLFEQWKKLVGAAYPRFGEEIKQIASLYGIREEVEGDRLYFAIQTYYSLILKLLSAEIASLFYDSSVAAYLNYLRRIVGSRNLKDIFRRIENGELYRDLGIKNFIEEGIFSWYLVEWDQSIEAIMRDVINRLAEYDITSIYMNIRSARDMLKVLYEELIPRKEVRQKLGIYSTPDWLAELVIKETGLEEKLSNPCKVRVLDPGCGTGTFLSLTIQAIGKKNTPNEEILKCVLRNVVGFDIDPLAVLTARTNYLISLAATGLLEHKKEKIEIPIYQTNSLYLVTYGKEIKKNVECYRIEISPKEILLFPVRLLEEGIGFKLLDSLRTLLNQEAGFNDDLAMDLGLTADEAIIVRELYGKLLELKRKGIDSVWIPIIKNLLAPSSYLEYFDFIIGNPPWLSYRYITDPDYQSKIKQLIKEKYRLVLDEHLMTHMELATLFFLRSADLYLRDKGTIGFVMPRSIFSADQHSIFRSGNFNAVKLQFTEYIDCEKVDPLFYVPTSVVIARKGEETKYPVQNLIIEGKLPEEKHKVLPLDEAQNYLSTRKTKLFLNKIGSRTFLGTKRVSLKSGRSYYYSKFYQGATIVPQSCWFVDVVDASKQGVVVVQSSRRSIVRGKVKETIPPMPVEREFIYGVLTSAEVLPFIHLPPNIAVLPIQPRGTRYAIITREAALRRNYNHLARWLEVAERIWNKIRGAKKESLYSWLDYQRKLTTQSSKTKYRVVYLRSATYLGGCILKNEPIDLKLKGGFLKLNGVLVDATLYRYDTDDEDEAYYLAAVFNSSVLDDLIKPLQSKGQFGPRDIHKKPLEFPIPKYNRVDHVHRRLSELSKEAAQKTYVILLDILKKFGYEAKLRQRGFLTPQEIGRVRSAIREALRDILNEIDLLVIRLFEESRSEVENSGITKFMRKQR